MEVKKLNPLPCSLVGLSRQCRLVDKSLEQAVVDSLFRLSMTVSQIGPMESHTCCCCHGGPPPPHWLATPPKLHVMMWAALWSHVWVVVVEDPPPHDGWLWHSASALTKHTCSSVDLLVSLDIKLNQQTNLSLQSKVSFEHSAFYPPPPHTHQKWTPTQSKLLPKMNALSMYNVFLQW